ncbi:MAG TPA: hypothetical protein VHX68_05355 [Planctomycetaceae bacterium]|jgi:hypothetical protein|nr:hypothetical protein [Planctomycetaceae bacterium]
MKRAVWASLFIAAFALGATLIDTSAAQAQRRDGVGRGGAWRGRPYYGGGYARGGYYPGYANYGYPYAYGGYPYYNGYYGGYYGGYPAYGYVGVPGVSVGVGRAGVGFGFGWW